MCNNWGAAFISSSLMAAFLSFAYIECAREKLIKKVGLFIFDAKYLYSEAKEEEEIGAREREKEREGRGGKQGKSRVKHITGNRICSWNCPAAGLHLPMERSNKIL